MGKDSEIAWTDHTFNPWWGCVRVSPGCQHCYAETFAKRVGQSVWGVDAPRRFFGNKHWAEPLKWNAAAEKAGTRARVFCASMADVFEDRRDLDDWRAKLWSLIEITPWLEWLLLTKRPQNFDKLAPGPWVAGRVPAHVRIGTTVEDQPRAEERIPALLRIPAANFLSMEPLIENVSLRWLPTWPGGVRGAALNPNAASTDHLDGLRRIDWVIVGGESGPGARPLWVPWVRQVVEQCRDAGVTCFVKQLGADVRDRNDAGFTGDFDGSGTAWPEQHEIDDRIESDLDGTRDGYQGAPVRIHLRDRKGGDPSEWPEDLRVREFPTSRRQEGTT